MTVRWHSIPEKNEGAPRWSWGRRFFVHWGPDGAHRSAHAEVYWRSTHRHGLGWYLRFDGPGAETPIDAAVFAGRSSIFVGTSVGRRLNRWLRLPEGGGSRKIGIELRTPDGGRAHLAHWTLTWALWTDPEHAVRPSRYVIEREGLSRWYLARRGYVHPVGDLLDRVLGKPVHTLVESDPVQATVHLEDGAWPVLVKLETRTWKRPRSPRSVVSREAWVDVVLTSDGGRGGPPNGRWKYGGADGLYGCGTRELTQHEAADPARWVPIAVGRFTEAILLDRARYGWKPTVPADRT
jgi:hypothetical protein